MTMTVISVELMAVERIAPTCLKNAFKTFVIAEKRSYIVHFSRTEDPQQIKQDFNVSGGNPD